MKKDDNSILRKFQNSSSDLLNNNMSAPREVNNILKAPFD